jgi:hypothetical protein
MLEKAKREYSRMKLNLDTDIIFNFFVTTYHIIDHVRALETIDDAAIQKIFDDEDFRMCKYVCNKGKHAILIKVSPYNIHSDGPPGGEIIHTVRTQDKTVKVEELADRLIIKWEKFFADNHI